LKVKNQECFSLLLHHYQYSTYNHVFSKCIGRDGRFDHAKNAGTLASHVTQSLVYNVHAARECVLERLYALIRVSPHRRHSFDIYVFILDVQLGKNDAKDFEAKVNGL
jgi:hypothetical protein